MAFKLSDKAFIALLHKIRCVRKSQFELEKVKHNICLKDDYLMISA